MKPSLLAIAVLAGMPMMAQTTTCHKEWRKAMQLTSDYTLVCYTDKPPARRKRVVSKPVPQTPATTQDTPPAVKDGGEATISDEMVFADGPTSGVWAYDGLDIERYRNEPESKWKWRIYQDSNWNCHPRFDNMRKPKRVTIVCVKSDAAQTGRAR